MGFPQDINSEHLSKILEDIFACSRQFPGQTEYLHTATSDLGTGVQLYPCGKTVDLSRLKKTVTPLLWQGFGFLRSSPCEDQRCGSHPPPHPCDRGKSRKQAGCHQGRPEAAIMCGGSMFARSGQAGRKIVVRLWGANRL